jgi:hypothetical protein
MEGAAGRLPPSDFYKQRERASSIHLQLSQKRYSKQEYENKCTDRKPIRAQTNRGNQRLNTMGKEPRNLNKHCLSPCSPLERGFSKEA